MLQVACLLGAWVVFGVIGSAQLHAQAPSPPKPPSDEAESSPERVWAGSVDSPVVTASPEPTYPALDQSENELCPPDRCGFACSYRCASAAPSHVGLLLRVTAGWGFGTLATSGHGHESLNTPSLALGMALDLGGVVLENLIIRGRLRGAISYHRESDFGDDLWFSFGALGVGADYYFMPINLYVGATVSLAGIARTDDERSNRSKAGLGLDLDVGKEWWVGPRWGVGIALRGSYMDVGSADILREKMRIRSVHVGLQLSATYN